jgi:crossover junction endodeoxyribonuclease RuvC
MLILGIDPGTHVAGYGVIAVGEAGRALRVIEFGEISMSPALPLAVRLRTLHEKLTAVVKRTKPTVCAIETIFTHKNVRAALTIGQARGVALLAAAQGGLPVSEYAPREVKKAVTGNGNATKDQVRFMVTSILSLTAGTKTLDASDALAIAICHAQRGSTDGKKRASSWKDYVEANPGRVRR